MWTGVDGIRDRGVAIVERQGTALPALPQAQIKQVEQLLVGTYVACLRDHSRRVLSNQPGYLLSDTLDQPAGEQIVGERDDLADTESVEVLHHLFEPWKTDIGKGREHQLMLGGFIEPVGHLGSLAGDLDIRGTPRQQHDAGGTGVRHRQFDHGLVQTIAEGL